MLYLKVFFIIFLLEIVTSAPNLDASVKGFIQEDNFTVSRTLRKGQTED